MTYYGAKELAGSFRTVRTNTIKAAEDIPESQYSFKPSADTRSVEKMLTHIALAYKFHHTFHIVEKRQSFEGFNFPVEFAKIMAEEEKPRTKAEVLALLKETGEIWATALEGMSDEFLAEAVTLPPQAVPATKSRFEMVMSVKEHEMHHRAQINLIQRMIGIVPHLTREREAMMAQAQAK